MFTPACLQQNSINQDIYTRMLTPKLCPPTFAHRNAYAKTLYTRMFTPEHLHQNFVHQIVYTKALTPVTPSIFTRPESSLKSWPTWATLITPSWTPELRQLEPYTRTQYTKTLTPEPCTPEYCTRTPYTRLFTPNLWPKRLDQLHQASLHTP